MMIPRPQDAIHKAWLYRLLTAIADDSALTHVLRFKGGTSAAMLNRLDRFSVDLDFDLLVFGNSETDQEQVNMVRSLLEKHAAELGLEIKEQSQRGVQYFFKYPTKPNKRNTIKVEANFPPPHHNQYEPAYVAEIDRTIAVQTVETMFANKLIATLDRWERHRSIAGRDVYDIHYFFLQGYRYDTAVITERRGTTVQKFFEQLIAFIDTRVTATIIQQDLNSLLPPAVFARIRKTLKNETLMMLRDEQQRLL